MGVKVVPLILFALAGECLSLTEQEKQVEDVLFKMTDKLIGIEKKLSNLEDRVSVLENSETNPKENKQTNLEDAMENLRAGGFNENQDQEINQLAFRKIHSGPSKRKPNCRGNLIGCSNGHEDDCCPGLICKSNFLGTVCQVPSSID